MTSDCACLKRERRFPTPCTRTTGDWRGDDPVAQRVEQHVPAGRSLPDRPSREKASDAIGHPSSRRRPGPEVARPPRSSRRACFRVGACGGPGGGAGRLPVARHGRGRVGPVPGCDRAPGPEPGRAGSTARGWSRGLSVWVEPRRGRRGGEGGAGGGEEPAPTTPVSGPGPAPAGVLPVARRRGRRPGPGSVPGRSPSEPAPGRRHPSAATLLPLP